MTQLPLFETFIPYTKPLINCKKGDKFKYHGRTWEYLELVKHPMNSCHNQILVRNIITNEIAYIAEKFTQVEFIP